MWKGKLRKFRFVVPAFVFVMTLFLIYLCVIHGFLGLFEYGYYATTLVLFGVFSMLFILWIAAFCNLVFGDAGSMEQEQRLCKGECRVRCIQCGVMKPLRAHHCSKCHTCFAKMDHHCDALGVCVALRNNKVFVVFLAYSIGMLFIYAGSCAAMIFIDQWESFPHLLLMDALTGGTLGVIVSALLAEQIYHIFLGQTALELRFRIPPVEPNKSKWERWVEVFGPPSVLWLLPITLSYDDASAFQWERFRNAEDGKSK